MKFAEKIRRARADRSYAEIGRACGCSPENIRKLEAGISEPGFRLGLKIASVLQVPADWLADDAADWPPPASQDRQAADILREALTASGRAGELSEKERRCLANLRTLPEDQQAEVFGFVKGLAAAAASGVSVSAKKGLGISGSQGESFSDAGKSLADDADMTLSNAAARRAQGRSKARPA